MEKSKLPTDLQSIVEQFGKFRNEYSTLKTDYRAQEELIKLQKLELEKTNSRAEKLTSTLIDYQRRFNFTLLHWESENQRLQKVIENLKRNHDNSQDNDNSFTREIQCNNDDYIRSLEEKLEKIQTEIAAQENKHQEKIKLIEERQKNEIIGYEKKIERMNFVEKRHRDEIESYKKKLEKFDSIEKRCIMETNKRQKSDKLFTQSNEDSQFSHPAFDDNSVNAGNKRKKSTPASFRWPQLDISVKKEKEIVQQLASKKKKKLYTADDEEVVDLTS